MSDPSVYEVAHDDLVTLGVDYSDARRRPHPRTIVVTYQCCDHCAHRNGEVHTEPCDDPECEGAQAE